MNIGLRVLYNLSSNHLRTRRPLSQLRPSFSPGGLLQNRESVEECRIFGPCPLPHSGFSEPSQPCSVTLILRDVLSSPALPPDAGPISLLTSLQVQASQIICRHFLSPDSDLSPLQRGFFCLQASEAAVCKVQQSPHG